MRKHHPKNERAAAIARFEASTGYRDFAQFHIEQARRFKRQLSEEINPMTGKPLAKATVHCQLMALKAFVHWLAGQPGYKSRISYSDAEYFNPSANDTRIATARRETPAATIDQIRHTLGCMPTDSDIARRNRALIAFALLSGVRDDALASLSLKHVDMARRQVFQDAGVQRQPAHQRCVRFISMQYPNWPNRKSASLSAPRMLPASIRIRAPHQFFAAAAMPT